MADAKVDISDPFGFAAGNNSMITDSVWEGCYCAPVFRPAGATDHIDTLQMYGNGAYRGLTIRDSTFFGALNSALQLGGPKPDDPELGTPFLTLDHSIFTAQVIAMRVRYPAAGRRLRADARPGASTAAASRGSSSPRTPTCSGRCTTPSGAPSRTASRPTTRRPPTTSRSRAPGSTTRRCRRGRPPVRRAHADAHRRLPPRRSGHDAAGRRRPLRRRPSGRARNPARGGPGPASSASAHADVAPAGGLPGVGVERVPAVDDRRRRARSSLTCAGSSATYSGHSVTSTTRSACRSASSVTLGVQELRMPQARVVDPLGDRSPRRRRRAP